MGGAQRYIGVAERRARLALRQRLAGQARVGAPEEVAGSLVALHGTDPATVYLAVGARLTDAAKTVAETGRALYETVLWCGCTACGTRCSCSPRP